MKYKCENCKFSCMSADLMLQHLEWCGKGKTEREHKLKVQRDKKKQMVKAMIEE
jgi:hypothetical protein